MSGDVLKVDKIGNAVSGNFQQMTSEHPNGLQNWGMLPGIDLPMDHVYERQEFFRGEIERTLRDGPDMPFMSSSKIKESNALKTQQQMLNNYIEDGQILPGAELEFNTFMPMANMAAKSAAKTNEVGAQFGISGNMDITPIMDKKHADALKGAVTSSMKSGQLDRGASVAGAQQTMLAKRQLFMGATLDLSSFMTKDVVKKLRGDVDKAEAEKKEIFDKIERAQQIGEVISTLGTLAAGGAGAVSAVTAGDVAGKVSGAGDAAGAAGGIVGGLAAGITKLYHQEKLTELDATITRASGEVQGWQLAAEAAQLIAKKDLLMGHAREYKESVKAYDDAVNDRRMAFASIGQEADKGANKGKPAKKHDQTNSAIMLWVESLFETKSIIDAATTAGEQTKAKLTDISKKVNEHRNMGWSNIEDIWGNGSSGGTRRESNGAELVGLDKMRRLTTSWLSGAAELKKSLDSAVGTADTKGASGTMAQSGYTGDF